jgi:membrane fusion protein, multidrug efflux system
MRANQRLGWYLTAVIIVLLTMVACSKEQQAQKGRPTKGGGLPAVRVQTAAAQKISVQREVDLAGTLVSPDLAKVSSEAPGIVREVLVELGTEVRPGQIMVKLEPRELQLALDRAISQVRQTEAQLGIDAEHKDPPSDDQISAVRTAIANRDDARAQLARAQRLSSQRLLPQADVDTAETRVKVTEAAYSASLENVRALKATLQERRAAVELAQKKLNDCNIKAPVAGAVSERLVQPGEFIRENTPVVSLVQMNPLKIKTAVQERYAGLIRTGMGAQFSVESFPGEKFTGKIAFISPVVDQTTRTFPVEVLVENLARKLKPGFFTKGSIYTTNEEVWAIPEQTISTLAGVSSVFIINQNKIKQQEVRLGARQGQLVEITTGIQGGETLAASNLNMLATGVTVQTGASRQADVDEGVPAGDPQQLRPARTPGQRGSAPGKRKISADNTDSGSSRVVSEER